MQKREAAILATKSVLALSACALAPTLLPVLATSLGAEALTALLAKATPLGEAANGLAQNVLAGWVADQHKQLQTQSSARSNHHVARALVRAASLAVARNPQTQATGKADRWAKALLNQVKKDDQAAAFFSRSHALHTAAGFWDEQVWPALQSGESLEHLLWPDFEAALQTVLADDNVPYPTQAQILADLRPAVLQEVRQTFAEVLLTDPQASEKADYYFKTFTTRLLTDLSQTQTLHTQSLDEIQEKLDLALSAIADLAAQPSSPLIQQTANPDQTTPEQTEALLESFSRSLSAQIQSLADNVHTLNQNIQTFTENQAALDHERANTESFRENADALTQTNQFLLAQIQALQSQLATAQTDLQSALGQLAATRLDPDDQTALLLESQGDLQAARSLYDRQEADLARQELETNLRHTQIRLNRAEFSLRNYEFESAAQDVAWCLNHGAPQAARSILHTGLTLTHILYQFDRLQTGIPLAEKLVAYAQTRFGPSSPVLADHLGNLAGLYYRAERTAEAVPVAEQALQIHQTNLGPFHPALSRDLSNLAAYCQEQSRFPEAEDLIRQAIEIDQFQQAPDHVPAATHLHNLAQLLIAQNRLDEAEFHLTQAQKLLETELPTLAVHVTLAQTFAELRFHQRRLPEAEQALQSTLPRILEIYGQGSFQHAETLAHIARSQTAQGHYDQAEPNLVQALQILQSNPHHQHSYASALNTYAHLCQAQNRLEEAEQALRIIQNHLAQTSPPHDLARAVNHHNLARLLADQEKTAEAQAEQAKAQNIATHHPPTPLTQTILETSY